MKKLHAFVINILQVLSCAVIFASPSFAMMNNPSASSNLSHTAIHDGLELFKFVQSADPEEFSEWEKSFDEVAGYCDAGLYSREGVTAFNNLISGIFEELPDNNRKLMRQIHFYLNFMAKEGTYAPRFIDEDHVLENVTQYIDAVQAAYMNRDFSECTRLITYTNPTDTTEPDNGSTLTAALR